MSSMIIKRLSRTALYATILPFAALSTNCHAGEPDGGQIVIETNPRSDGSEWDRIRAQLLSQSNSSNISQAISLWQTLSSSDSYSFDSYASFLVTHSDWPDAMRFRRNAETSIDLNSYNPGQVIAFFEKFPPVTNAGKARYAIALYNQSRQSEAKEMARAAWRGGTLSDDDETRLLSLFGREFTADDHDARMDALLWRKARNSAERQIVLTSPKRRPIFAARLAMMINPAYASDQLSAAGADAMYDAGYVASRANMLRSMGNSLAARQFLASRPALQHRPSDQEEWYEVLLTNARAAANDYQWQYAYDIASKVDDAFPSGTDISAESLGVRDDYTSLTWLAGTVALYRLNRPKDAVEMFARYGNAARTPQTRSKGYYWAGYAARSAGDTPLANRWFEQAAEYGDHFYGQLALEALDRPMPHFSDRVSATISATDQARFYNSSLVQAVEYLSKSSDWRTQVRFFRALAGQAETEQEHLLVADLARKIGRRDLAVIVGLSARTKGISSLQSFAFPQMPVPPGYDSKWTMIHAITRQESQYAQNAISHAGARGLMQLMPGTAREQAGKMGLSYSHGALTDDPFYNVRLGSGYFDRMLDYFGGSYPLAVAAYNAGPGNVNKWLRANGDPRTGQIDILRWIEEIPIYETKNYVQRVLENAVVYDSLRPDKANMRGDNKLSRYLGKRNPG